MRRAVIDVGSNSVLLTVCEESESGWAVVVETTAVTALGAGTKETGLLCEQSMCDTLAALASAFRTAHDHGTTEVLAAATMAARIALNTQEFLDRAAAQGTPMFVLSGDDEAQLGFHAVAEDPMFAQDERLSIIDPGGHSTELVTATREGTEWTVGFRKSFPVGTLGLRGTLLKDESPGPAEILHAVTWLDDLIGLEYRPGEAGKAVVLGATGTNLVTIREGMTEWDPVRVHGAWLDFEEVSKAVGWTMRMTDAERAQIVGIEPGRERTIHLGSLILERFLWALHVLGVTVSVRGWRHAMLQRFDQFV